MKKYNSILVIAVLLWVVSDLSALEKPFLNKSTKNIIKKTAQIHTSAFFGMIVTDNVSQKLLGAPLYSDICLKLRGPRYGILVALPTAYYIYHQNYKV